MRKVIIKLSVVFTLLALVFAVGTYMIGSKLAAPVRRTIGKPPVGLTAEDIVFPSDGRQIKGWLIRSGERNGVVVLMHGVRADRTAMAQPARFLYKRGYSVLLFDFQAHGQSGGDHITFGYRESQDARAAVRFARSRFPGQPVGIIAQSMGGAACLVGPDPIDADALILESVYPTIEEAVANRLETYLGKIGRLFTPVLIVQLRWRFGIDPHDLRPIDGIKTLRCPVLIIGGNKDRRTPVAETQRLFRAASQPKSLWIVKNAGHQDMYRYAKGAYEKRITEFLGRMLRPDRGA